MPTALRGRGGAYSIRHFPARAAIPDLSGAAQPGLWTSPLGWRSSKTKKGSGSFTILIFQRPAPISHCGCQTQNAPPFAVASRWHLRCATHQGTAQRRQFRCRLRAVDVGRPTGRQRYRPRRQPRYARRLRALPQTRPAPLFRLRNQPGSQRIPLHITADRQEVVALLDRERFETSLVYGSRSHRVVLRMPAPHCVTVNHCIYMVKAPSCSGQTMRCQ